MVGSSEWTQNLHRNSSYQLFFSNNLAKDRTAYVERFADLGIDVAGSEVLSAGTVTTQYLVDEHPDDDLFVIGSSGLREQFAAADLTTTGDPVAADVLVASFYRGFDYDSMRDGYRALADDDTAFLGTDPDVVIPTDDGMVPGSGAIINAVAGVAERDPDRILGKPSPEAVEMALEALGVPAREVLVVGDRLNTDIALGERAGMTTVLVRSGVTDDHTLREADVEPDFVLDSLSDIDTVLS